MPKREADELLKICSEKKPRAIQNPIDLSYPYNYVPDSSTSVINPPFLNPNGPLYDSAGGLNLKCSLPLDVSNKSLVLRTDSSLETNDRGQLSINVDSQGPLVVGENGLDLDHDDTLETNDWKLSVNFAEAQPISVTRNGITINVDDTMLIDRNDQNQYELGVHLNHSGPITADSNGVDLEINENSLQVTEGVLSVKVTPPIITHSGGLTLDTDSTLVLADSKLKVNALAPLNIQNTGLGVNYDADTMELKNGKLAVKSSALTNIAVNNTMTVSTSGNTTTLSVKLKPQDVIVVDSSGIHLHYNSDDFIDDAARGLSTRTPIQYLSPYCTFKSGDPSLTDFSSQVRSSVNLNWNCSYYLFMANSSGMVNASFMLLLDKSQIINKGDGNPTNELRVTFVVNPSGDHQGSHSLMRNTTVSPNEPSTNTFFIPNDVIVSKYTSTIPPLANNWFVTDRKGQVVTFRAKGQEYRWTSSNLFFFPAKVNVSPAPRPVIVLDIWGQLSGQNWYDKYQGTFFTGPVQFSYQGSVPTYTRN